MMKKSVWSVLTLGAVIVGVTACNSARPVIGTDSGTTIVIPDGGPHDAGPGTTPDTGGGGGGCTLAVTAGNFGALSAACLPRCAGATLTAINACPTTDDGTCLNAALNGDTTPGVAWSINGMAAMAQLDCGGCFSNQQLHCLSASGCGSQVDAYVMCASGAGMPTCTTEVNALNTCGMTNQTAFGACANGAMGIVACFGG